MDSVPCKVEFRFGALRKDGGNLEEDWQILLRIVGDFSVLVNGRELYAETEFCVVEFAAAAAAWLRDGMPGGHDFVFTSMEAEEAGLVRAEKGAGGWRLGSVHQQSWEDCLVDPVELGRALTSYVQGLADEVELQLGIDVAPLLG
jgi:hypothetical protein